jgi:hypothetical protein
MFTFEGSLELLRKAHVFFPISDDDDDDEPYLGQTLNLSDTWGWACADGEPVPDDKIIDVATLFWSYGWCGILYWVSERRGQCRSEFADVNRQIDFVRHEEAIRREVPESTRRAYTKRQYTIGEL